MLENDYANMIVENLPVLCDDGIGQDLLLGRTVLPLLGYRRLILLFLEFATHDV